MKPIASILISSHNRLPLFRRALWALARCRPSIPFEVVVADDGSTDNILGELRLYSSQFPWTFIRVDSEVFERETGIKQFFNCPCLTNNVAFAHASPESQHLFLQGNEVIAWDSVYDKLLADVPKDTDAYMVMSTTYDVPPAVIARLDNFGSNLTSSDLFLCYRFPLQSEHYRSDVTNYISLCSRSTWRELNGYDERYFGGISAEDSDFVRRARCLPNFRQTISEGVSLHQSHGGKTCYYEPKPSVISRERFAEGCQINRVIYDSWDGRSRNPQSWPIGTYGVREVVKNS